MAAEALQAVRAMDSNSAPGPDGVGPGFYAAAWPLVRPAIMDFLDAFYDERADIQRINRALIVLIPKTPGATTPSAFRLVSLQNCPVKILTKLLTTRLQQQIGRLIDVDQTAGLYRRTSCTRRSSSSAATSAGPRARHQA